MEKRRNREMEKMINGERDKWRKGQRERERERERERVLNNGTNATEPGKGKVFYNLEQLTN